LASGTEIARRTQVIRDNAAEKQKSDAVRDGNIADMTAFAGGTLHYYTLTI
jgi:hypothetical protein